MQLAVDIGNSACKLTWMQGEDPAKLSIAHSVRFTHEQLRSGEAKKLLPRSDAGLPVPVRAGVSSVVPSLVDPMRVLLLDAGISDVRMVQPAAAEFFPTRYRTMETLGADRYCAVLAARSLAGSPVVVIDCGTATTFNVVDREGYFRGGAIAPGIRTAFAALHRHTAQLPELAPAETPVFGDDSISSIRSGVLHFTRLALIGMLHEAEEITGPNAPVFVTGGNAPVLKGVGLAWPQLEFDEYLLARGVIFFLHFTS
ncbi:type III pantothenate kinase [bacterium]|nr:type III pantothenate kinase [bacterium]